LANAGVGRDNYETKRNAVRALAAWCDVPA
jgi:hypothetical protein